MIKLLDLVKEILDGANQAPYGLMFFGNDKVLVGVKNLNKLQVEIMDKNEFKQCDNINCSMCQEEIENNLNYIKLPCNHLFHYDGKDCLEGSTVFNWLEKNKYCPNCKQEINLEDS
jgi:hypothetical protein